MTIAWSRISSKFITDPPCVRQYVGDRVGRGDASGNICTANDRQRKGGSRERVSQRPPRSHPDGAWFPSHRPSKSPTVQRSALCLQPNETHKHTLKPDRAVA